MDILQNIFEQELNDALEKTKKERTVEEVEGSISDIIKQTIPDIAKSIITSLKEQSIENIAQDRLDMQGFVYRNIKRWKDGFHSLEMFIAVCMEAGSEFNNLNRPQAVDDQNVIFDVVVRLHARACHISSEILWLLKGGFPDAAQARWRALHEVVVTALVLLDHDNDLSVRYLEHEIVECYKGMVQCNKYEPRLNVEKFSEEEIAECKQAYDEALDKYGKQYKEGYGWASEILNNPRPNFFNLEEAAGLDYLRPYYKWASQNIHANVHGIKNQLGLVEAQEDILLAGPSNSGMTDPAQLTSLSLMQISTCMLEIYPNIDSLVIKHIIEELSNEVGELFWKVESAENP